MLNRLEQINSTILKELGDKPLAEAPTLLAVSKKQPYQKIKELYGLGIRDFGENYLQEALLKQQELSELQIRWHYIGSIQSKKIRDIVGNFFLIQTVSRLSEAEKISRRAAELGIDQNILVQVNIASEESKQGFHVSEVEAAVRQIRGLPNVNLLGLMVFPPLSDDEAVTSSWFTKSRQLFTRLKQESSLWKVLSMGTSQDFALATRHGSTLLRVGETLMGRREES